jgi:hypothetical protein
MRAIRMHRGRRALLAAVAAAVALLWMAPLGAEATGSDGEPSDGPPAVTEPGDGTDGRFPVECPPEPTVVEPEPPQTEEGGGGETDEDVGGGTDGEHVGDVEDVTAPVETVVDAPDGGPIVVDGECWVPLDEWCWEVTPIGGTDGTDGGDGSDGDDGASTEPGEGDPPVTTATITPVPAGADPATEATSTETTSTQTTSSDTTSTTETTSTETSVPEEPPTTVPDDGRSHIVCALSVADPGGAPVAEAAGAAPRAVTGPATLPATGAPTSELARVGLAAAAAGVAALHATRRRGAA